MGIHFHFSRVNARATGDTGHPTLGRSLALPAPARWLPPAPRPGQRCAVRASAWKRAAPLSQAPRGSPDGRQRPACPPAHLPPVRPLGRSVSSRPLTLPTVSFSCVGFESVCVPCTQLLFLRGAGRSPPNWSVPCRSPDGVFGRTKVLNSDQVQ